MSAFEIEQKAWARAEKALADARCEFDAEANDECEECHRPMSAGDDVYWFSDGPPEPRDGTYVCKTCAVTYYI